MKKLIIPAIVIAFVMFLGSCGSTKKIVYFQGADTIDLSRSRGLYDARIMPKDIINIKVSTSDPDAAKPFNIDMNTNQGYSSREGMIYGYLVDNDGNINFPMVGIILNLIKPYMASNEKPVVTVRMSSYHITVVGEAGSRIVPVSTEKMSIVEALASAGDMTMYGRRDNILLIREDKNGQKSTHRLDISSAEILNSPYYYLQQNDIIYIEPNKSKINRQAISNNSIWISATSMVVSLASVVVALLKK